jgi:hypothetical protein
MTNSLICGGRDENRAEVQLCFGALSSFGRSLFYSPYFAWSGFKFDGCGGRRHTLF